MWFGGFSVLTLLYYHVYDYNNEELSFLTLVSILNGPSHMFLDVITERGIYVKRNGKWTRFALAHFSNDNPTVNGMAMIAGVIMLLAAMELHNYHYYYYYK